MTQEDPVGAADVEIRGAVLLPARREDIELHTADGLTLVGELALPLQASPVATIVALHPLPTAGGFMDSHIIRKAAARLPALADIAVLRFNFRGVSSPRGKSEGAFGHGDDERYDLEAAMPDATLIVIDDVGHLIHYERPQLAAAEIRAFLDRVLPEGTAGASAAE